MNFGLLSGNSTMLALMRQHDWSQSPLGHPENWPSALRTVVGLMLDSKFPMFVAWGPELAFLYNDSYSEILGSKHPAALGRRFHDIWSEIWDVIEPLIQRALAGEATYSENLPLRMVRKGHEEQTWFTFSYSPVRDENGVVAGMFCAVTETTAQILSERRQAFELTMANRLRELAEPDDITAVAAKALGRQLGAARVGYGEIDLAQGIVSVGRDWSDGRVPGLGGQTRPLNSFGPDIVAELHAGRTLRLDNIALDARSASYAAGYASIGAVALLVVPLIKAGELTAVLYLHQPHAHHWTDEDVKLAEQVAEHTWGSVERARAEARRRDAEEALSVQLAAEGNRLRALFAQAPGFMAVLRGPEHVFELANTAFMRLVGERRLVGKTIRMALPELEGQNFFEQLDQVYRTAQPFFAREAPATLHRTPGEPPTEYFIDFIYQPVIEADGTVSGIFIEGYDVTDRKLANEALLAADRRKDEFLAMLAHELRNPLAPISHAAQILRLTSKEDTRIRKTSEVIARQVEHMTGLVDDLLDVSRVTRGLIKLDCQPVDLRDAMTGAVEQVRALIDSKHHTLELQTTCGALHVLGDRSRLIQVIANLLNNAAKYTPEHGHILARLAMDDDNALIEVRDNGVGMDSELLPHVFDLFTQGERSPDRFQGGLGLGLALVKSLVGLHGGSVRAASPGPDQGSEFTVRLPLMHNLRHPIEEPVLAIESRPGVRALIVDDNMDAADSLGILLESDGHQVGIEYSGKVALERMQREMPQVCLLDIGLPDMDGYELARRIRALPGTSGLVLIALTGYGQAEDHARSAAAGFNHHLVKPARAATILELLAHIGNKGEITTET